MPQKTWLGRFPVQACAILVMSILVVLVVSQTPVSAIDPVPSDLNTGPYVDHIVYKVIAYQDQRIIALQAGEIVMHNSFFNPQYLAQLSADPDIDIFSAMRNGYGHMTINCRDYPLNISGLRRAFAFAFDKTRVTAEIMEGFSIEHDSLVPQTNGWCIEDDFDWHYYTDQSDIGNQILDDLGFEIDNSTGYRNAPNGEPFDIIIEYAASSPEIAGGTAQIGVDAWTTLYIDAEARASTFDEYGSSPFTDYDMIFYATNFYDYDIDWLAYSYWSEYANNVDNLNPTHFINATYDSWRNQLLHGTTYEEVYDAASEMQKILHYNVPLLVVYENTYMQGYRNDVFTGHVEDLGRYISGPWTMRKIQKLDDTFGGIVPVAIHMEPDSFNIYVTDSAISTTIMDNLYSSLYKRGPDLNPWPDLATNMITETHSDNAAVPEGHTRFTIDIVQNATWSDGTPLTATDVAFTYTYQYESSEYGNPAGEDLGNLVAAFTPNPYRVVLEYSTESYWHFSNFAFDYIIPEHIFNDETGIGYEGWNTWNPVLDPEDPHVTSGPFILTDHERGEFYELTRNPQYNYLAPGTPIVPLENPRPVLHSVSDVSYIVGITGNEIVWEVTDDNPLNYFITQNFTVLYSASWDGSTIKYNVDGLEVGTHEFRLNLFDISGNFMGSTVFVNVLSNLTVTPADVPILYAFSIIGVSSVSFIVILYVVVEIVRSKKQQ